MKNRRDILFETGRNHLGLLHVDWKARFDKECARLEVHLPRRGCWAKLQA